MANYWLVWQDKQTNCKFNPFDSVAIGRTEQLAPINRIHFRNEPLSNCLEDVSELAIESNTSFDAIDSEFVILISNGKEHIVESLFLIAVMWWWILWHLYWDWGHIVGEFEYPDVSKWTDAELGIPPDDFDEE